MINSNTDIAPVKISALIAPIRPTADFASVTDAIRKTSIATNPVFAAITTLCNTRTKVPSSSDRKEYRLITPLNIQMTKKSEKITILSAFSFFFCERVTPHHTEQNTARTAAIHDMAKSKYFSSI